MTEQLPVKDKSYGAPHLKVTSFRKDVRKTEPHKHNNYFEMVYLLRGSGYHLIDHQRYEVKPPVIFFIRREQIHGFELDDVIEPDGFVLIVKKLFIDTSVDDELKTLFSKASNDTCLYLDKVNTIEQIFELLVKENETGSQQVIEGLLKALLAKILQTAQPISKSVTTKKNDLFQTYLELLSVDRPIKNQVAHYANLLNTTPQNLNAICRKAANINAASLLAGYIVSEAKRLLLYTNKTVSEISLVLDFNDASHFIKYFKKLTGKTPKSFRLGK